MKDIDMKNVPNAVWYCMTLVALGILASFVVLAVTGTDASEFRSFLNTVLNFATVILSGGAFAFAGATTRQTNGALDRRIKNAIADAIVQTQSAPTTETEADDGRPAV